MMRARLVSFLAVAALSTLAAAPRARSTARLVVISIDGLRCDYVLEADRYGLRIPELRRLLREGAHASGVRGVLPTVTYPSHTTLVTGVAPARHGILANGPFDPQEHNREGWYWYAEDIKVETLWDAAAKAALSTASVDWPVTVGARIRWNIPQVWRASTPDDAKLARALSTPGLLEETERVLGPWPSGQAWTLDADRRKAGFNRYLLEGKKPDLHFAYFTSFDEAQHDHGPESPEALPVLEAVDGLVGEVRQAAERRGGGLYVAVVSDHGFIRTERELELNEALREAGLLILDARGRVTSWRACAWSSSGSAAIMLADPRDEEARRKVGEILVRLSAAPGSGIERILTTEETRAAGGFPDAAFVVGARPGYRFGPRLEGPVLDPRLFPHGDHGFLPDHREMDATFLIAGPGIAPGRDLGRIDMRDVAPTLAGVLGLSLPAAEGRDLLSRSTP